ncbi:MAG: glycosyltransferase family 4 protein [Spirochaetes bacterium]|nr:glycosyltransferase family 4 protein [Spirochaetota bacterium]
MARICMVAYSEYISDARIRREAEALAKRGDEVECICLSNEKRGERKILNGVWMCQLNVRRYRGSSSWRYILSYFIFLLKASVKVTIKHIKTRYDVIQVHTMPDFMVFSALIPRIFGARVILDVHDLVPELYISKFKLNENHLLIKTLRFVEKISIAFAHKAISVHKIHLEALVGHGNPKSKFEIIMNTPDPEIFYQRGDRKHCKDFKLVYHGTISRRHGLELSIRAMELIRERISNVIFKIIGEGDDVERLIELVEDLNLSQVVEIIGKFVPVHELPKLIEDADLGIVPLVNDSFTQYMLPVKLMEYIALNIPVIVTKTRTVESYFDDTMVEFISGESEEELAECVVKLHDDPQRRLLLSKNARDFTIRYNWEKQKQIYYNLIESGVKAKLK